VPHLVGLNVVQNKSMLFVTELDMKEQYIQVVVVSVHIKQATVAYQEDIQPVVVVLLQNHPP